MVDILLEPMAGCIALASPFRFMTDFTVQSDAVDVTKLMAEIRAKLQEKRGVDYTEAEIRELASVTLARFLDPKQVRSDLLEHYRRLQPDSPSESTPQYFDFNEEMVYASPPGARSRIISLCRRLARPLIKIFFNSGLLFDVLERQSKINRYHARMLARHLALPYELFHNLVVETTRLAIETQNQRMRIESLEGRVDFDEQRAEALESVVQYRPGATAPRTTDDDDASQNQSAESDAIRRRRARARRRRR